MTWHLSSSKVECKRVKVETTSTSSGSLSSFAYLYLDVTGITRYCHVLLVFRAAICPASYDLKLLDARLLCHTWSFIIFSIGPFDLEMSTNATSGYCTSNH
ncbi:hypothetical protein PsorP6_011217 [Peronosclerospora sorghi]|uniref:Uncharacterized protein n=1 Tax=Peronosclerospora sorghi TaxID=230839 RepID=A0ACC0VXK6_9STRA|nr:hypothetical protein PsorP6_011217 [Peronosclerospora sorghi]